MSTSAKTSPTWAILSLITNAILLLAVILLIWRQQGVTAFFADILPNHANADASSQPTPELGNRHKLNYQQWVDILKQEATVAAEKRPDHLNIIAGDSLSLWFPTELLPEGRNWLNQGISGENSTGLLKRLKLFDRTQPETIFVMIGINDLIQGKEDEIILQNHRRIVRYLRQVHPHTQIVIQSILPHGGKQANWEGREKLLAISNSRIQKLNQQLQTIAKTEGVKYLNLHPLFVNKQGHLRPELSTDGLHLNSQGYLVWSSALQLYSQMELEGGR
ncbi:G-D-S-L family lipolytic protein [Fischerella thermalis CCMEE 5330]|uniref:G-D-S-L family lipolytic protein n=1 Tax=Fischerella thermalis CCMEE 5330 TaxID=2019670 RepID=A0A2N6M9D5_9CYAN|nr:MULTISPECIES: SGNH/GDSL hydrolase family protein [Fischerella]PMB43403.1 G-D-S-L family lipolytic protein [Fischerella thermalis CCMEE 5330]BAU08588.1 lipolytic enzyme [Fischerella sp. NIES-3754]